MVCSLSLEVPTLSATARTPAVESAPVVQFDDTCVVIPDPVAQSRMPRLIKKSYSLPLWRKRSHSSPPSEPEAQLASSPEDRAGMSITVSVPSFAKSRSPTRGEHHHQPLVSCLVNGAAPDPRRPHRRPSLPLPPHSDAVTIPLQPCCRECYPITEECLKEGVAWEEKFTRGARRRRNSSADIHAHAHAQRHRRVCDDIPGFGTVVSIDEVEKRRSFIAASASALSDTETDETDAGLLPSFSRRLNIGDEPTTTPPRPIVEEAEDDDLFPLPSPSTSPPPLPRIAHGDEIRLPSEDLSMSPWSLTSDGPDELSRSSVYYTPEASPSMPVWEPSSTTSSPDASDSPVTPPQMFAETAPIPLSSNHRAPEPVFSDFSLSSFELIPITGSSPSIPSHIELSTSPGGKRKQFRRMPSLPSAGSFLRAGADIFKGVTAIGSGGPMPLSV